MKLKPHILKMLFVAMAIAVWPTEATQVTAFSVEELTEQSRLVLHGTVLAKTVQRDPQGRIYTRVELQVAAAWKGSAPGGRFVLVHGGGVLGEEAAVVSGQETYEVGEEVVAFLVLNQRGEGVTLGLAQGKFHVATVPGSGEKLAHNPFHGRAPEASSDPVRQGARRPALGLAELKTRVQGGRP